MYIYYIIYIYIYVPHVVVFVFFNEGSHPKKA